MEHCFFDVLDRSFTMKWRIENFRYFEKVETFYLKSSRFESYSLGRSSWCLTLQPSMVNKSYLQLTLTIPELHGTFSLECELAILGHSGNPVYTSTKGIIRMFDEESFNLPIDLTKRDLFGNRNSKYLPEDSFTIRLRVWEMKDVFRLLGDVQITRTVIAQEKLKLGWPIENFRKLQLNQLVCKVAEFKNFERCPIELSLTGPSLEESALNFAMDFRTLDKNTVLSLSCDISLIEKKGKSRKLLNIRYTQEDLKSNREYVHKRSRTFLERREVLEKAEDVLKEHDLALCLDFKMIFHRDVDMQYDGPYNIETDLVKLCGSEVPSDTSTSERPDSPTNLTPDSAMNFLGQFLTRYSEDISRESIPPLDFSTINRILTFLYVGTIDLNLSSDSALEMYCASVKYQIHYLKTHCLPVIKRTISISNVSDVLVVAEQHRDEELKSCAHEFIFENLAEVISSQKWNEFKEQNLQLAVSTMSLMLRKIVATESDRSSSPMHTS